MDYKIPTFLKWAGGKRRILKDLTPLLPSKVESYFEPFLGGGAFFFFIKQKYNPKFSVISDINEDLILTYQAIRDYPEKVISFLKYFKKNNSAEFYYKIRVHLNIGQLKGIKRCAAFIYLNKTCYNGLFRVNSRNKFNVPYGQYENPEIFNQEDILFASRLLQNVQIKNQDYREIIKNVGRGSLVYLDPCYDPIKRTSFVHYTPKSFSENDRIQLRQFIRAL
jgi:DNA adenine methylase